MLAKHFIDHPYFIVIVYTTNYKDGKIGDGGFHCFTHILYYLILSIHIYSFEITVMFLKNQPPACEGEPVPDGMTGTRLREHCNVDLGRCHPDLKQYSISCFLGCSINVVGTSLAMGPQLGFYSAYCI